MADPSQIIITKTLPPHKQKSHNNNSMNNNNNNINNNLNNNNTLFSSNNYNNPNKRGFRMQQSKPELFTSFKHQSLASSSSNIPPPLPPQSMKEPRSQFSIRGRSNTIARPAGLSIRGESGPSIVLISNLDPRTNSEDVKVRAKQKGLGIKLETKQNTLRFLARILGPFYIARYYEIVLDILMVKQRLNLVQKVQHWTV
jgi:hypothetical protein